MSHIIVGNDGKFYVREPGGTTITQISLPSGVAQASPVVRPSFARYSPRRSAYVVGWPDANLTWVAANNALYESGMTAPEDTPAIRSFPGGTRDGINAGYFTWKHKVGSVTLAESNPSPRSNEVTLSNQGLFWTGIPATAPDSRTTHAALYVEVAGEVPAHVADIALGTTTYEDTVADEDLGETLPVDVGLDGAYSLDAVARSAPPYSKYIEMFDDRMWYAGCSDKERIYPSRAREPEAVNVELDGPWKTTRGGEPVTGLARYREKLIVGCSGAIDFIDRVGDAEYRIDRLSSYYDVASHHSMKLVGPNDDLWFLSHYGIVMYDGAFRFLCEDIADWIQELIRTNPANWEASFAGVSRRRHSYLLVVPQSDGSTWRLVGDYRPVQYGGQPRWTIDKRTREDTALGELADAGGYNELYCGSEDGYLRKEDVWADGDDDGDTLKKVFDVTGPHHFRPDQGGDEGHGRSFDGADVFLKNENTAVTVSLYAGDDSARDAVAPQKSVTIAASAEPAAKRQKVAKTSHTRELKGNGKGASLRFRAESPVDVELRGYVLYDSEGDQEHPFSE